MCHLFPKDSSVYLCSTCMLPLVSMSAKQAQSAFHGLAKVLSRFTQLTGSTSLYCMSGACLAALQWDLCLNQSFPGLAGMSMQTQAFAESTPRISPWLHLQEEHVPSSVLPSASSKSQLDPPLLTLQDGHAGQKQGFHHSHNLNALPCPYRTSMPLSSAQPSALPRSSCPSPRWSMQMSCCASRPQRTPSRSCAATCPLQGWQQRPSPPRQTPSRWVGGAWQSRMDQWQ